MLIGGTIIELKQIPSDDPDFPGKKAENFPWKMLLQHLQLSPLCFSDPIMEEQRKRKGEKERGSYSFSLFFICRPKLKGRRCTVTGEGWVGE